mgnify:CR=1 FL=1
MEHQAASRALPVSGGRSVRRGQGAACSLVVHAGILLLALLLRPAPQPPPEPVEMVAIAVDVVQGSGRSASPSAQPQPQAMPAPVRRPPEPSRPRPAGVKHLRADVPPAPSSSAIDDFDTRLRAAEQAQRPSNGQKPGERAGAGGNGGSSASGAGVNVKDFIRAQIARRWNFDVAALGGAPWRVAIHVVIAADGTVDSASIVEDPRYRGDPAYQALARSARNAALVSSPLQVPAGLSAALRDMVLEFDPRAALR